MTALINIEYFECCSWRRVLMLKKRNCLLRIVSAPLRARETPWNPRIQRKNNELRPQLFFRLDFGEIQRVNFSQKMNQTVKIQRVAKSRGFGANPGKSSATKRALELWVIALLTSAGRVLTSSAEFCRLGKTRQNETERDRHESIVQ